MTASPSPAFSLDALDLAALLCSRVCHDVINPVGAIVNAIEVLEDDADASTRDFALDLIKSSARKASARLRFARIAFGAAGSAGAAIDTGDAEDVARGFIQDDKVTLDWAVPRAYLPKNQVKLLLNLLVIAAATIPRGGTVAARMEGTAEAPRFIVTASGVNPRLPPALPALLAGEAPDGAIDSHAIQPFYTGLIARAAGLSVTLTPGEGSITLAAG